jgi:hypothetical protein
MLTLATLLALAGPGALLAGQPQPSRATDEEVKQLLTRIEKNAEQFRRSLAETPDREWIVGVQKTRNIDHFVTGFVGATRRLRSHFDRGQVVPARVEEVLRRGVSIDSFMERHPSADQAAHDWATVRRDLEALAAAFNVPWNRATSRLTSLRPDALLPQGRGKPRSLVNQPVSAASATFFLTNQV